MTNKLKTHKMKLKPKQRDTETPRDRIRRRKNTKKSPDKMLSQKDVKYLSSLVTMMATISSQIG